MGLGARLATLFAIIAAATAFLVGGASYVTADRQVINEIDSFLENRVGEITGGERQRGDRNGRRNNDNFGDAVEIRDVFSADAEVQFLDKTGGVTSSPNNGMVLPVTEIDLEIADDDVRPVIRTITVDETEYRMITAHLDGGGAVQVARSLDESAGLLGVLQRRLITVALSLALIAGGIGWIVAQRTTRPLRALTTAVDEVAQTGDFTVPVPSTGSDEVGRLAREFNRMLDALQKSQNQQHRLVQDAAHELRTPLTSITVNIEWLMHARDLDADTREETLSGIRGELRELNGVIAEIIELATDTRKDPEFSDVMFDAVVEDAVGHFSRRTGREVTLDLDATPVVGNADSLNRAVTNLLSNAHKYSPAGEPIAVELKNSTVMVHDAGQGIPEAEREMIFERFYRRDDDRSEPGSGLGLSIVAHIVDQHNGRIKVGDSPLGGASVGFEIPKPFNDD